jgi:NurA domain.
LARKYSDRYIFIDGSIISDSILYLKFLDNFYNENIENRRKEFLENFEYLINNGNLLAVAKRILNLDIIRTGRSDLLTLMKVFPSEIFYTDIGEKQLKEFLGLKIPNCSFCNKKIYIVYFRARYNDHIYRLEGMEKIEKEKFKEIIKEIIYDQKSYPRGLKMAHNLCKITNKEKLLLESYIKKSLGFEKTVGWETH